MAEEQPSIGSAWLILRIPLKYGTLSYYRGPGYSSGTHLVHDSQARPLFCSPTSTHYKPSATSLYIEQTDYFAPVQYSYRTGAMLIFQEDNLAAIQ